MNSITGEGQTGLGKSPSNVSHPGLSPDTAGSCAALSICLPHLDIQLTKVCYDGVKIGFGKDESTSRIKIRERRWERERWGRGKEGASGRKEEEAGEEEEEKVEEEEDERYQGMGLELSGSIRDVWFSSYGNIGEWSMLCVSSKFLNMICYVLA